MRIWMGAVTSRSSREDVIPVGGLACLLKKQLSPDFSVGPRPSFDQHSRKGELAQGVCEVKEVTGKAGAGEDQARQAFVGDRHEGACPEANDGGGDESEERRDGAKPGGSRGFSHAVNLHPRLEGSPEKDLRKFQKWRF